MKKNVLFIYGENVARMNYIKLIAKRRDREHFYMTIDDLNFTTDKVQDLESGNETSSFRIMRNFSSFIDRGLDVGPISFAINHLCGRLNNYVLGQGDRLIRDSLQYIYMSWVSFLNKNKDKLSFHESIKRKLSKYDIKREDLNIRFINKNTTLDDISEKFEIGNVEKSIIDHVFSEFNESDQKGINDLVKIEEGFENKNSTLNCANYIVLSAFCFAISRKLCKLGLEWVAEESRNPNSPIKGFYFIEDYFIDELDSNNQVKKCHHKLTDENTSHRPWNTESSFAKGRCVGPITASEFRYLKKVIEPQHKIHTHLTKKDACLDIGDEVFSYLCNVNHNITR
ncbi:hypothetical protein Xbed_01346 [Xenorhabdus beddingii]|uniref:Uncharacterized protein n=1 Tax=Xenorhabdus beddingii TaxID=40578 RepID=A0A1Y2SQZ2_9GAMM|nr:hypothetical protein [Xenorhabdus beddingii]OTA20542.1 hypothetical protein Xbed_01346 [Xenorhabdus beddingii]